MRTPSVGEVADYLRAHDWTVTGRWRDADVWSRGDFDVLVPPADDLADTPIRLRELARCVADAEDRTLRAVWRDLGLVRFDIVRYRAGVAAETVPVPAGLRAVRAMRDLLVLGVRDTAEPPDAAEYLMSRSRLALGIESFGLDVVLPAADADPSGLGRRAALRMLGDGETAQRALAEPDIPAALPADVYLALADLAGADRTDAFELTFRWSLRAPRDDATLRFPPGAGALLHAGATGAGTPIATGVVEGPVTGLADDEEGDRRRIRVRGVLTVDGTPSGRRRPVPVRLATDRDYDIALAAHRDGRAVRAAGEVTEGRTRGIAAGPGELTVLDTPSN